MFKGEVFFMHAYNTMTRMISLFDLYVPDATASAVDKPAATIPKAIPASAPATNPKVRKK